MCFLGTATISTLKRSFKKVIITTKCINVNIKTDKGNVLNNNKIKILKRTGFWYKDFKFIRGRILYLFTGILSCSTGTKTPSKVKITNKFFTWLSKF